MRRNLIENIGSYLFGAYENIRDIFPTTARTLYESKIITFNAFLCSSIIKLNMII